MVTANEARKVLETERKERLGKCQAELNSLLETHKCQLQVQLVIVDGRIRGNIILAEKPAD